MLVYLPLKKRYQRWIAATVGTALWASLTLPPSHDFSVMGKAMAAGMFIAAPVVIACLAAPKMGGIYYVPPKHRARSQGNKPSGTENKAPGKQEDPQ